MSNAPIKLVAQPDFFIPDVVCPYCKQPTLGVWGTGEEVVYYRMQCFNAACVTNFTARVASHVQTFVENSLKTKPKINEES